MKIVSVTPKVSCFSTPSALIPFYKLDEHNIVMIDSGFKRDGVMEKWLDDNKIRPVTIINTHAHIDHIMNNSTLQKKYGSKIYMSSIEAALSLTKLGQKAYYNPISYQSAKEFHKQIEFHTDYMINPDEKQIVIEDATFRIIHSPGHSVDHICIITPDDICVVGDVLMSESMLKTSQISYSFCHEIDLLSKEYLKTLNCNSYVLAHKGIVDNIKPVVDSNIEYVKKKAEEIKALIKYPMGMDEIVQVVSEHFKLRGGEGLIGSSIVNLIRNYVEYLVSIECVEVINFNNSNIYKCYPKMIIWE